MGLPFSIPIKSFQTSFPISKVTHLLLSLFQLLSGKRLVDGYHIEVRDWSWSSSQDLVQFDAVDISGGATRSHTLSDLRPNTRYSIFILPHSTTQEGLVIRGRPSNMKTVRTKEDGELQEYKN